MLQLSLHFCILLYCGPCTVKVPVRQNGEPMWQELYSETRAFLLQSKDDESAYMLLHQLMQLYNYRQVFSPDLSTLQVKVTYVKVKCLHRNVVG